MLFVRGNARDARRADARDAAGAAAGHAPVAAGGWRATCRCCCSSPGCRSSAIALADPHTGFTREEVSYPGRRIALLVDASTSMVMQFKTETMKTQGEATFFTAVAGAEQFIKRRMNGPYRDLVALIQFGNQAYVVTPFTTDYENILLSIRLVSDPREWGRFSDWGTTIIEGIDQATQLFKTFYVRERVGQPDGGVHRRPRLRPAAEGPAAGEPGCRGAHVEDSRAHDSHRLQPPRGRSRPGQDLATDGRAHGRPLLCGATTKSR